MHKLMEWLGLEAEDMRQIVGFVFLAALIDMSLSYTVRAALINWGFVETPPYDPNPTNPYAYYNVLNFASAFLLAPLMEETIFRVVPLMGVIFFTKRPGVVFTAVVIFAILFGSIHPYGLVGKAQVTIAGLIFGLVYLKSGGLNSRVLKAAVCCMAAHGLSNVFLTAYDYYEYLERVL